MQITIPNIELAHEKHGHLYPPILYWLGAQLGSKKMGVKNNVIGVWTTGHEFSYMTAPGGLARAGKKILMFLEKDEKLLSKIISVNTTEIPQMLAAAKKLSGNLSKQNNKQLAKLYQAWLKKFLSMMTYSILGTVMEMETPLLTKRLTKILTSCLGTGHPKIGEYFQTLTTSATPTIAAQEELKLLELKEKQLLKTLSIKDIFLHTKNYSWIAFGYDGPGWTTKDIKIRLQALPNNLKTIKNIIKNKKTEYALLKKKQNLLTKQLKLNRPEQRLFNAMRTLGFWKVERKFRNQQAHELMEDFIKEVAKRNFLSVAQVKMISPKEMIGLLKGKKVSSATLNERLKESLTIFNGISYEVISGQALKPISKKIKKSLEVDKSINSLNGQTAYPGHAEGKVKIIDTPEEMKKMKRGNILVSASTSPQILPAMKKAGAIVTNSGGITCHAAIVAREIKIPTLIGTKIATKIFKDGDLVEVDANRGMVKLIKP